MPDFRDFRETLEGSGWAVTDHDPSKLVGMTENVWQLTSTWSPANFTCFLHFLSDPLERVEAKKADVWRIEISEDGEPMYESLGGVNTGRHWAAHQSELIEYLDSIRNQKSVY